MTYQDHLDRYMDDVRKSPFLEPDEEKKLGGKIVCAQERLTDLIVKYTTSDEDDAKRITINLLYDQLISTQGREKIAYVNEEDIKKVFAQRRYLADQKSYHTVKEKLEKKYSSLDANLIVENDEETEIEQSRLEQILGDLQLLSAVQQRKDGNISVHNVTTNAKIEYTKLFDTPSADMWKKPENRFAFTIALLDYAQGDYHMEEEHFRSILTQLPKEMILKTSKGIKKALFNDEREKNKGLKHEFSQALHDYVNARNQIIKRNQGLVVSVAKRYRGKGLEFLDLIQEGNMGLMKAATMYDPTRETRFGTYASTMIRHQIIRSIYQRARTVRIPVNQLEKLNQIRKIERKYFLTHGEKPTSAQLASFIREHLPDDAPLKNVDNLEKVIQHSRNSSQLMVPLDTLSEHELAIGNEQQTPLAQKTIEDNERRNGIYTVLTCLPIRSQYIIILRYGLGVHRKHSQKEIGELLEISRVRVGQLETQAIQRLSLTSNRERVRHLV